MPTQVTNSSVEPVGPIQNNINYDGQSSDGSDLNDLDLVARYILAVTHSKWNSEFDEDKKPKGAHEYGWGDDNAPRPKEMERYIVRQNVTGEKTIAVAASGNTLYVAHNGAMVAKGRATPNDTEKEKISKVALRFLADNGLNHKISNVEVVNLAQKSTAKSFHAEMQLLSYLRSNGKALDGRIIGVSKPCCSQCANQLDALNISYSLKGENPIGAWGIPDGHGGGMLATNNLAPLG